jgi:NADPH-dependent 2,4-dienoyl-CoA reductase/sulfur reductase-like enzyme
LASGDLVKANGIIWVEGPSGPAGSTRQAFPSDERHAIGLKLGARAVAIDPKAREVRLVDGSRLRFGALLLTGAEPPSRSLG